MRTALIIKIFAVPVLKKKKPRRGNQYKIYNQITDLDEYRTKDKPSNTDKIEKEAKSD
jgi:hypothetical protein